MSTSNTARDFKLDLLSAFDEEIQPYLNIVVRKFALEALKRVVMKSPVDTGRFRGNWSVSFGSPIAGEDTTDKTGDTTIARGSAVIDKADAKQIVWLSNHLPYASALENGHSQQAPAGVVAVTYAELQAMLIPPAREGSK